MLYFYSQAAADLSDYIKDKYILMSYLELCLYWREASLTNRLKNEFIFSSFILNETFEDTLSDSGVSFF